MDFFNAPSSISDKPILDATRSSANFELTFSSGEKIEGARNAPSGVDVFADARRYEVLRNDENLAYADLLVRVW
jgi:hypothetical protein